MYHENIRRAQLMTIVDKFRQVMMSAVCLFVCLLSADCLLFAIIAGARQAGGRGPRHHRLLQEVHRPLEMMITVPLSFS